MKYINEILDYADKNNLYPDLRVIEGGADPEVIIDGKKVLMFSSNNYLSLASHPNLKMAAKKAIDKYGTGSGGSRLLSGNLEIHIEAEKRIASYKGGNDAIIYPCGYSTNVGVISGVMNLLKIGPGSYFRRKGVIISDELNHASIVDGCILSKQKVVIYEHNNVDDLEDKLKSYKNRRKLVVTDGVFSMDGDISPLDKIFLLTKKYNSMLMIDEAHATGMLGKKGHGTPEYFNINPKEIDIIMGTFSKSLGSHGGFVVGSKDLIRYLRIASRAYMFSTAMTPSTSASIIAALDTIENDQSIRENMWKNAEYLRKGLNNIGFNTLKSETQIIPLLIGKDEDAIMFTRKLFDKGIFGPCVRWPAVEKGKARIRFTVMSNHKIEQIDRLIDACKTIGKNLKII